MRRYFDQTATTPLSARAAEAMRPYLSERFGNANALYREGREAASALEDAHRRLASCMGARMPQEIIATSGGTESDVSALYGLAQAILDDPKSRHRRRIVVSSIEHHAVLEPARKLQREGFTLVKVDPRPDGRIHPDDLAPILGEDVALVSIMTVNNELGTVQPIGELARISHEAGALFHTDAVQALGKIPLDMRALGVDAASFSAHKLYGPKGTGALYLKHRTPFQPLLLGGGQEGGFRSGTSNVAGMVGFSRACEDACADLEDAFSRACGVRAYLLDRLRRLVPAPVFPIKGVDEAGTHDHPLLSPYVLSCLFEGYESETLVMRLDERGFCVSGGSACSSRSLAPSHVMSALRLPERLSYGQVRISLGHDTDKADVDALVSALQDSLGEAVAR